MPKLRSCLIIATAVLVMSGGLAAHAIQPRRSMASRVAGRITVRETEFLLRPAHPQVPRRGLVVLKAVNRGTIVHALAIKTKRGVVRTHHIAPGSSAVLKVRLRPGRYRFYCPIDSHRQFGMKGVLKVG